MRGDLEVRRVSSEQWRTYRDIRLAALLDSPRAFWTTYAEAAALTGGQWRQRLSSPTWLAWDRASPGVAQAPVGLVALWQAPDQGADHAVLVQMWVATWARGSGAADALIATAVGHARGSGVRRLTLEVAQDNPRAQRCYLRHGFRHTGRTGSMPWEEAAAEAEMALDLKPA